MSGAGPDVTYRLYRMNPELRRQGIEAFGTHPAASHGGPPELSLREEDTVTTVKQYHPGMHAKTLIADDEIAVIDPANVSQRSFTNDSETSVVVFGDSAKTTRNFARTFRSKAWEESPRGSSRDRGRQSENR